MKLISFITIQVLWTRFTRELTWNKTQKSSSKNSVFIHRNRVQWTQFPCMENEFIELVLHVWKMSPLNSFSMNSAPRGLLDQFVSSAEDRWLRLHLIRSLAASEQVRCENKFKNSFCIHGKRVRWTRFSCLVHPIHLMRSRGTELEIELARLDFRKWSPALHVLPWVPAGGPVYSLSVSLSQIEHFLAHIPL